MRDATDTTVNKKEGSSPTERRVRLGGSQTANLQRNRNVHRSRGSRVSRNETGVFVNESDLDGGVGGTGEGVQRHLCLSLSLAISSQLHSHDSSPEHSAESELTRQRDRP